MFYRKNLSIGRSLLRTTYNKLSSTQPIKPVSVISNGKIEHLCQYVKDTLANLKCVNTTEVTLNRVIAFEQKISLCTLIWIPIVLCVWIEAEKQHHRNPKLQHFIQTYLVAISGSIAAYLWRGAGWLKTGLLLEIIWRCSGLISFNVWSNLKVSAQDEKGWLHMSCAKFKYAALFVGILSIALRAICFSLYTQSTKIQHSKLLNAGGTFFALFFLSSWVSYFLTAFLPYRILRSSYMNYGERMQQLTSDLSDFTTRWTNTKCSISDYFQIRKNSRSNGKRFTFSELSDLLQSISGSETKEETDGITDLMMTIWYHIENNQSLAIDISKRVQKSPKSATDVFEKIVEVMDVIAIAYNGTLWKSTNESCSVLSVIEIDSSINKNNEEIISSNLSDILKIRVDHPSNLDLFWDVQLQKLKQLNKERARAGKRLLEMKDLFEERMELLMNLKS